jgi:hypothetical protein
MALPLFMGIGCSLHHSAPGLVSPAPMADTDWSICPAELDTNTLVLFRTDTAEWGVFDSNSLVGDAFGLVFTCPQGLSWCRRLGTSRGGCGLLGDGTRLELVCDAFTATVELSLSGELLLSSGSVALTMRPPGCEATTGGR